MIAVKDSVHDHIEIDGVGAALLDTPPLQRLRRISQMGTVTYVYPSANHTRFEHSLGVYHIASQALEKLGINGRTAETIRAAALLHDVGHGPFSHNTETVIHRHTGRYHDEVADLLELESIATVLDEHGIDPTEVAELIRGDSRYGQLISGELDVDRMDYLVRDAHHTGVPYGTIDHERFVRELKYVDGELVLAPGNVQTAESLLLARALMNRAVYNHPTARISRSMLARATERLIETGTVSGAKLRRMDDHDLMVTLRSTAATEHTASRLDSRSLFKRAVWAELDDVPERLLDQDHTERAVLEDEIAEQAGVDPSAVILDVPPRPSMAESTSRVIVNGEIRRLASQSALVRALLTAQRDRWRFGVYTPPASTVAVGQAAERVLGLDMAALVTEDDRGRPGMLSEFTGEVDT